MAVTQIRGPSYRLPIGARTGAAAALAAAVCVSLSGCSSADPARADGVAVKRVLAEHATDLVDDGPAGPMVLLPGAPDAGRQFAAALALSPYQTVSPYLGRLAGEWSGPDSMYGTPGRPSIQAEVTRTAAELARSSAAYRQVLFPAARLSALTVRAAKGTDPPGIRAALADAVALLGPPSTVDCARLTRAVLDGDLAAASRLRGPLAPDRRCAAPPANVVGAARDEAGRLGREVRGWRMPGPGQITDLWSRLAWISGYPREAMRAAQTPVADALAAFLDTRAVAAWPFLPNLPPDELRLLFDLIREARPEWRPPAGHLAQLRRTLDWRGRLPEQVRNDPTTFVFTLSLLQGAGRSGVLRALPRLRAGVLGTGDGTALDTGLRAVAVRRPDLITDRIVAGAAAQAGDDPRLGARLAALVSYGRRCPAPAARVLEARLRATADLGRLQVTDLYYQALIAHGLGGCPGRAPRPQSVAAVRARAEKQASTVEAAPGWPGWFELWLLTESSCALGVRPRLDAPGLSRAASTMLSGAVWDKLDPTAAYALSRSLDIAGHGCEGAWFTS